MSDYSDGFGKAAAYAAMACDKAYAGRPVTVPPMQTQADREADTIVKCDACGVIGSHTTSCTPEARARKAAPIVRGLLDYFPDACRAIAQLSYKATQQHHPDKPMHWDRNKSQDHADSVVRHIMARGKQDGDGVSHTIKAAWRALALLQSELDGKP